MLMHKLLLLLLTCLEFALGDFDVRDTEILAIVYNLPYPKCNTINTRSEIVH